jgi:MFS family permease
MTTINPPRGDTAASGYRLTTGTLVAAALAVCIAQMALSVPAVLNGLFQQDLSPSSTQLTWISDAFLVPVTLLELSFGVVGDLFGRKRLLAAGSFLLATGTLIGFFTPGPGSSTDLRVAILWTGQIIAGIGAAAILPTSLAMIAAGTHNVRDRSKALSIWAAALTAAGSICPVMAGWLARFQHGGGEFASWRWAFLALAALGLISTVVTLIFAGNSSSVAGRSLDWPGQITIALAVLALLYAVIEGSENAWTSGKVVGSFALSAVFFVLFVVVERRTPTPLLHLEVFANRAFTVSAIATVVGMFAYLGTAYSTSIRLSAIQGFTPLRTSIAFVLLNIMGVLLFPFSARLIERHDPRWSLGGGFGLIAIGDIWLSLVPASNLSIKAVAVPLLLVGAGFKLALTAITAVAVNSVPNRLAGMASGTTSMLRDFGLTLGPAVIGAIALGRAADEIAAKLHSTPALAQALQQFNNLAAAAPAAQKPALEAAIGAVNSGPLGANAVPATATLPTGTTTPFNPLKDVAFHALDNAYSTGYLICGISALVAALLAALALGGGHQSKIGEEPVADGSSR